MKGKLIKWLDTRIAEILDSVQREGLIPTDKLARQAGALSMAKAMKKYVLELYQGNDEVK